MAQKKEYRSAIRSRRMIQDAFLELLHEKSFDKITVTDIVRRADINRSTFYAHYPDVMGLVEALVEDVVDRSLALVAEMDFRDIFDDPMPFLAGLTGIGAENMHIYRLLGNSEASYQLIDKMKIALLDRSIQSLSIPEYIRSSAAFRIQINFFIGGVLNTYQQWLQGNLDCTMEEIVRQMSNLIQGMRHCYPELTSQNSR